MGVEREEERSAINKEVNNSRINKGEVNAHLGPKDAYTCREKKTSHADRGKVPSLFQKEKDFPPSQDRKSPLSGP